jgi:hypothetical protein
MIIYLRMLVLAALILLNIGCSPTSRQEKSGSVALSAPAGLESTGPRLSSGPDNSLILSWMEPDEVNTSLRFASYVNGQWGAAQTVISKAPLFVNWADLPSVVPVGDGRLVAHWLIRRPDNVHSYDIMLSHSMDGGHTWSDTNTPHKDNTATEHGFVSIFSSANTAGLLWLDGRKMVNERTDNPTNTGMTLRAASLGSDLISYDEQLVDDLVCDCCQTDVAVAAAGPIAVYRDRSSDEIRDISVSRLIDGQWQASRALADDGWRISGCPVNGPSVVADGNSVAVGWFTAANSVPKLQLATSVDGGASFTDALELKSGDLLGRVGIAMLGDDELAVSWLQSGAGGKQAQVMVRKITAERTLGPEVVVSNTASQLSVPQMVRMGDSLIFAWTEIRDDAERIASAKLPISALGER